MIKDLCEISAILSHKYTSNFINRLSPELTYTKTITVIANTGIAVYKSLEEHLKKADDLQELYDTFGVTSFKELVIYLGGKHMKEFLGIEVSDGSTE